MSKLLKKVLEVLLLVLLGISLAACGDKETEEIEKGDEYGYIASFRELKSKDAENGYVSAQVIKGDMFHYIFLTYEEVGDTYNITYEYHKQSLTDGSDTAVILPEDLIKSGEYISGMSVNNDGTITAMFVSYDMDTYEETYSLKTFDDKGTVLSNKRLEGIVTGEDSYIYDSVLSDDGYLFITTASHIIVVDREGTVLYKEKVSGHISSLAVGTGGKAYMVCYSEESWNYNLYSVDAVAKKVTKLEAPVDGMNDISVGLNNTVLFSGNNSVKAYNPDTKEMTNLWSWFEVDAGESSSKKITQLGEDEYQIVYTDYSEETSTTYAVNIRKELLTEENRRINLTYGCIYLDYRIRNAITRFNRSNTKYRVLPVEYSEEYNSEDIYKMYEQDVQAGKFDLIQASSTDANKHARSGAFADLTEYFRKDIDSSKYNETLLNAFDIKGKKYYVVPDVGIETILIPTSVIGNKTALTLSELFEIRKKNPNIAFSSYGTKSNMFYTCFYGASDSFIDYEKGTCNFTSDTFIQLLEFANTFPEDINYENYNLWELRQKREIIMADCSISEVESFQVQKEVLGGDVQVVGIPGENSSKSIVYPSEQIAISAKSKHIDECWNFLKYMLSEEYQDKVYDLPILKSSIEKKFAEAATPNYYTDENGEKKENPKTTYWIEGGDPIEVYAATKEDIDQVRLALDNVTVVPYIDTDMYEIISEELDSFFKGGKTAKEVADILQSRVKIYLAEKY